MMVKEVVEAHGGMDYWNSLQALDAVISAWGLLFTAKRRPVLKKVRMRAYTREPRFTFFDFPQPGQKAELFGNEEVCIKDIAGNTIARRVQPRAAFRRFREQLYWDNLDFIYFGGYATWNYLTTPFLVLREGFLFEELEFIPGESGSYSRLQVTFPQDVPTHSAKQVFYFDERRYLRRIDYTAEVVGRWAHAAHLCADYRTFGGIQTPTRRQVLPLFFGYRPLPAPTLVALEVHDLHPVTASPQVTPAIHAAHGAGPR
jgi:hypothetical protein